jgi:outer membrane protein assembly factor BamE (lipoprotein component of BamABCDE complex)
MHPEWQMGKTRGSVNRQPPSPLRDSLGGCSAVCSALAAGLAALGLVACSVPVNQHGNLPEKSALEELKPGVTDKATVTRILGSPSSIATFDDNTWYYISQKTKDVAFFRPEVVDQQVLVIDFDKNGVIRDVRHRSLEDGQAIEPNPNATPAAGREFSFIEQLIGNFGKFNSNNPAGHGPGGLTATGAATP